MISDLAIVAVVALIALAIVAMVLVAVVFGRMFNLHGTRQELTIGVGQAGVPAPAPASTKPAG